MKQKLKIGLILDNYTVPYWIFIMLEDIKKNDYATIVLSINHQRRERTRTFFSNFLLKVDRLLFRTKVNALKHVCIKSLFNNDIKQYELDQTVGVKLTEHELKEIGQANIDVFFSYGSDVFDHGLVDLARFGIWTYILPDSGSVASDGNVFWEVLRQDTIIAIALQVYTKVELRRQSLLNSYSSLSELSINRNLNAVLMKASAFVNEKLKGIYNNGNDWYEKQIKDGMKSTDGLENNEQKYLSLLQKTFEVFRWLYSLLRGGLVKLFCIKQWVLLYKYSESSEFPHVFSGFNVLKPPRNKFWADPHIIYKNEKYYVFYEECNLQNEKGVIALMVMGKSGKFSEPVIVLEEAYHLSYPFVFEHLGEYYMIPESEQNNSIDLYKCLNFPHKWVLFKTIISDIKAVDTTILFKGGLCWLFANVQRNEGASIDDELFIYYADSLFSENWISHANNPVVSDVRKARPAGKFFMKHGELFRPAQDCSKRYGYGMKINKVTVLNENNFQEEEVESVYPNWDKNVIATHTFNAEVALTFIDAQFRRRRFFRKC